MLLLHELPPLTTLHGRFLLIQRWSQWWTEHRGSSSLCAMQPSADRLQHAGKWTATTSVQWRNAIIVSFSPSRCGGIKRSMLCIICVLRYWSEPHSLTAHYTWETIAMSCISHCANIPIWNGAPVSCMLQHISYSDKQEYSCMEISVTVRHALLIHVSCRYCHFYSYVWNMHALFL